MALLEINDLHTYYGKIHALRGISLEVEEGGSRIHVTASVGISMLDPSRMDQSSALVDAADEAMYRAKARTRGASELRHDDLLEKAI